MKKLFQIWLFSVLVMVFVDYLIGPEAEFVDAWSLLHRLAGQTAEAGESMIYRAYGMAGETVAVIMLNLLLALLIMGLIKIKNAQVLRVT